MSIDKNQIRKELTEVEFEKNWNKIKYLTGAVAGVGAIKVGQILIPKAVGVFVGETLFLGSLAIPGYFTIALGVAAVLPVYTNYKKTKAEKANRKAEDVKNNECFELED